MEFLFGYDIHDAGRRRRALKRLRALTPRWQHSFFACGLAPLEAFDVFAGLANELDAGQDGLVLAASHSAPPGWRLSPACMRAGPGIWLFD